MDSNSEWNHDAADDVRLRSKKMRNWRGRCWGLTGVFLFLSIFMVGCAGPSNPTLRDEGHRAYLRGEYDGSIASYQQVLERKPEDEEANLWIGRAYLAKGNLERARTHLSVAYQQAWAGRDQGYEIAGYLAEAIARDNDPDALFALLKDRSDLVGEARDYERLGDYAIRFDDPDTAETAYRMFARILGGRKVEPYLKLAALYERIGKTDEAVRRLRQAYAIDPSNDQVVQWLSKYVSVVGPTLALPPDDDILGSQDH